jgi:ABC-2 type transport system ATP-binding protein
MGDMSDAAIQLAGVTKRYGDFTAVRGLDLRVPVGATYALLGPNGAGKTTTIRIILRIIEESAGEVRVLGGPVTRATLDRIGYLPEERGVYKKMTVRRLLAFLAELKGVGGRESRPRIDHWLERLELADRRDARVEELSKGMQQKLQFIGTILHEPEIVILDEPFSGLDPINQRVLRDIVGELRREGRTILFSTHIIEHAERICDHVCIIARGARVVDGPLAAVKQEHGERYVALAVEPGEDALPVLEASPLVDRVREDGAGAGRVGGPQLVRLRDGADANALLHDLVQARVRLRRFELVEPSLEQIFIDRVGRPADVDAGVEEVVRV